MCKSSLPAPTPTTEVADKIQNSTSVDNSWSFINMHLPSTITTAVIILLILITAWILFRIYARFNKARPQTTSGQTPPSLPTLAPTPIFYNNSLDIHDINPRPDYDPPGT